MAMPDQGRRRVVGVAALGSSCWWRSAWTGDRAVFIGGMNVGDRLRLDRGNIPAVTEQGAAYHPR